MPDQPKIARATTAVVFNDMINSNLRSADEARNAVIAESGLIPKSAKLVAAARAQGLPIVWIRVERRPDRADVVDALTDAFIAGGMRPAPPVVAGTVAAANVDELPVQPEDLIVLKPRFDPFIGTNLDLLLRKRGIQTILLGGYSTNMGVESTARTARDIGYNVVILSDCCFNAEVELHEWTLKHILPRFARVMTADQALGLLE